MLVLVLVLGLVLDASARSVVREPLRDAAPVSIRWQQSRRLGVWQHRLERIVSTLRRMLA